MVKRILNEEIPSLDPPILIEFLKSKGIHYKEYYEEKLWMQKLESRVSDNTNSEIENKDLQSTTSM